MDFLKRNWFWLLSGGLVLGFGAFWGVWVWGDKDHNDTLRTELDSNNSVLHKWVDAPKSIPAKGQAEEYKRYAETLSSELAQSQALLKSGDGAEGRWRHTWPEQPIENLEPSRYVAAYRDKVAWLLQEDPAAPEKKVNLGFMATKSSFDLASYTGLPPKDQIAPDAKKLMIQIDLVNVLNAVKVLRLPTPGIVFTGEGGADASGAGKTKPKADSRRTIYPFTLSVDLKLQDLQVLLDSLVASSFNYAVTGLKVDKLKDREVLANAGFLPTESQDEVVRVVLACEASDYFLEKPEKKP